MNSLEEIYFLQLTKGCGNSQCSNAECASCESFKYKEKDENFLKNTAKELADGHENNNLMCKNMCPVFLNAEIIPKLKNFNEFLNNLGKEAPIESIAPLVDVLSDPETFSCILLDDYKSVCFENLMIDNKKATDLYNGIDDHADDIEDAREAYNTLVGKIFDEKDKEKSSSLFHLRSIILLFLFEPFLVFGDETDFLGKFKDHYNSITDDAHNSIIDTLSTMPQILRFLLDFMENSMTVFICENEGIDPHFVKEFKPLAMIIDIIFAANASSPDPIDESEFVNEMFSDLLKPEGEMLTTALSLNSYISYPFLLKTGFKLVVKEIFAKVSDMSNNYKNLEIEVNRETFSEDVMKVLLMKQVSELNYKLRIKFVGEVGGDEGGVTREFYNVCARELYSAKRGLFKVVNNEFHWFTNSDDRQGYKIAGLLTCLAFSNDAVLPIRFPTLIYKKLLRRRVVLKDIEEFDPALYNSLSSLLTNKNVGDAFLTMTSPDGKPFFEGGDKIDVTNENVEKYVDEYVKWYSSTSIKDQFTPFSIGFKLVGNSPFELFSPSELSQIISGVDDDDWEDFKEAVTYEGYNKDDESVKMFWDVFDGLDTEKKRTFLLYLVGLKRAPIGGFGTVPIVVQRSSDTNLFPVAHTCTGFFTLPDYKNIDKMKEAIEVCIENCEGFGVI